MLRNYVEQYIKAEKKRDKKEMKRIENKVYWLGIDLNTFMVMVSHVREEYR